MKIQNMIILAVLYFFIVSGCNNGNNEIGTIETLSQQITNEIQCTMLEKQIPGLSVSVLQNGNVIYQEAFGKADIAQNEYTQVDTPFAIASMTKIFTTFAVLQLIEDGLASLDDPISMHIPDLPNELWGTRTIRNLLSMSSGIPELAYCADGEEIESVCEDTTVGETPVKFNVPCMNEGFNCEDANNIPYETYLDDAAKIPLQFNGGGAYFYSNSNFLLLGVLIEALSGKAYEEYLNENVLLPLGMTNTEPNTVPPPSIPGLAVGYKHTTESGPNSFDCINFENPPSNCAPSPVPNVKCEAIPVDKLRLPDQSFSAGWLVTNQLDMAKLEKALNDRSPTLLDQASYNEMWTNTLLTNGNYERFGLGWGVCSELDDSFCPKPIDPFAGGDSLNAKLEELVGNQGKVVYKDGALQGYGSIILRYLDDGLTVIIFINNRQADGDLAFAPIELAAEIVETVRDN